MKTTILASLLLPVIFALAIAQEERPKADQEREDVCRRAPCRPAKTLKLEVSKTEVAELDFPKGPYVADDYINVLPGEEINVEFDYGADGPITPRYVEIVTSPEKTVTFKLSLKEGEATLAVKNPLAKAILYQCSFQRYKEQRLIPSRIFPVQSGQTTHEIWPYPITQVVVSIVSYAPSE